MLRLATAVACVGLLCGSTGLVWAQTAQEVLQAAAEKLTENPKLRASMTIHGEGSEMFRSMLPKGEGTLILRRVEADGQTHWESRVSGKSTTGNAQETDPIDIDFVKFEQTHRWIDHAQKKVFDMVPARAMASRSAAYSASKMLVPAELMEPQSFKNEFEAEELAVLDSQVVNGVACDVLEVTYPKPAGGSRSDGGKAQQVKLFFGQDDHLLHRVERISGAEVYKMVVVLEFDGWKPDPELGDKDFELAVPEGYELVEAKPTVGTTVRPTTARPVQGTPRPVDREERAEETGEKFEPAPDFAFTLGSGEEVTLESLRGATAVLYFWGTWCLECRDFSPLVSKLAADTADQQVRVFGLAMRERDPASPKDLVALRDYHFEVAPNAVDTAAAFGIVYFPTFVVISPEGGLVGTEAVRRGSTIDGTMARVQEMIEKASPKVDLPPAPQNEPPTSEDIP